VKNPAGDVLRLIQIRLATPSLTKIIPARQAQLPQARIVISNSTNAVSFFLRMHNETLSVIAMP
jgi:hypothetical protein